MKKLLLLVALFFTIQASAQIIKPDLTRSPNGPNTIVDWNVKFKTMIIPHGNTFSLAGGQDSTGAMRLRVAGDTSVAIYIKGFGWLPFANKRDVTSITTILARNNTWTGPNIFNNTVTIGNSSTISGLSWNIPPSGNATLGNLGIISDGGNDGYSRITFNILGSNPASLDYGNHGIHPNDGYLYIGGGSYGTYKRVGVQGDTTGLSLKQDTTHIKFRDNAGGRVSIQLGNLSAQQITNPASDIMITADIQLSQITGSVGGGLGLRSIWGGYDVHIGPQLAASITNSHHSWITGGTHPSIWGGSYIYINGGDYSASTGGTRDTLDNSNSFNGASLDSHSYGVQNTMIASQSIQLKGSNSSALSAQKSYAIQSRNHFIGSNGVHVDLGTRNLIGPVLTATLNSTGNNFALTGTNIKIIAPYSGTGAVQNAYVGSSYSGIDFGLSDTIRTGGVYNHITTGTLQKISSATSGSLGTGLGNTNKANYGTGLNGKFNLIDTLCDKCAVFTGESGKTAQNIASAIIISSLRGIVGGSWATVINGVDVHALGVYDLMWGNVNTSNSTGYHVTGGLNNTNKAIRGTIMNGSFMLIDTLSNESTQLGGISDTTRGVRNLTYGAGILTSSYMEIGLGSYPTRYTAASATGINLSDRAMYYGNGTSGAYSNAFTFLKSGHLGLGGIDSPVSWFEVPANTASVPQLKLTASATDYTGTVSGSMWNNAGVLKWYDGTAIRTVANTARTITSGYGLTGGGDLSTNRTFTLDTASASGPVSKTRLATNLGGYAKLSAANSFSGVNTFTFQLAIKNAGFLLYNGATANYLNILPDPALATSQTVLFPATGSFTVAYTATTLAGYGIADGASLAGVQILTNKTLTTPKLTGYTVSTLPAGTIGMLAYVSDALTPAPLATVVGGGTSVVPVFYNGTNWIVQ